MKILQVLPGADYCIIVRFSNSHAVTLNMKSKLRTARFSELSSPEVFELATTDGKAILWGGGISIAISEIIEMVGS